MWFQHVQFGARGDIPHNDFGVSAARDEHFAIRARAVVVAGADGESHRRDSFDKVAVADIGRARASRRCAPGVDLARPGACEERVQRW